MSGTPSEPIRLRLAIFCVGPPASYTEEKPAFGIQDTRQVLHPGEEVEDGAACFRCEVLVKQRAAGDRPDFVGPFVHGPAGARFLYLSWRKPGGGWIKRLKIPLTTITWEQVREASQRPEVLMAEVSGAGSGTVPLLGDGWALDEWWPL